MPAGRLPHNSLRGKRSCRKAELSRRAVLSGLAASPVAMEFLRGAIAEAQTSLSQSGLVGEIQGPTMITDPAKWPKKFAEAPMLAELVKAGKLPPVEQRVPAEPMVWQPLNEIGKYGGTWRRAFTGPADGENGNRIQSSDKPLLLERGRQQDRALRRQGLRTQRRRQDLHAVPAQGHEVVRWRAVHRRRFHLLVRGHLQQSRRSFRRRRRRCVRRASPAAWSRWTRPRCAGNSTCRITCSRTSWPATRRWAADRPCARPRRSASAPMRPAITSSSSCRNTRRSRR